MAIAIGTDYWLYARARVCNATGNATNSAGTATGTAATAHGGLTHSGLWRVCCLEGLKRGLCLRINHFPEDLEYDHDSAEYLLRVVRASSIFPILSAVLLLLGGLCVAASRLRRARTSLVLGAGILFVAAGLSNIIGVIVYISANAGGEGSGGGLPSPPRRDGERRPSPYSYGWSFYFGGVSFILAEAIGVLAVNLYIERHRKAPPPPPAPPPAPPLLPRQAPPPLSRPRPPRRRSRSGSRSSGKSRDPSPPSAQAQPQQRGKASASPPPAEISMYTLSRGGGAGGEGPLPPPGVGVASSPPPPPPGAAPLPPPAPPGTPGPAPPPPPPGAFLTLQGGGGAGGGAETPGGGTGTLNRKTTPV